MAFGIAGITILAVSGIGVWISFSLEVRSGEAIWMAGMKLAALGLAVGGVLTGIGVAIL